MRPESTTARPTVLMVGLGSIGQRHLRNLRKLGHFEYVAWRSRNLPLPDEFAGLHVRSAATLEEALAANPALAFLGAPPAVQGQALPVLVKHSNCHVFIEKPIANSVDGLESLADILDRQDRTSMIGFNLRFHPVIRAVDALLAAGAIGTVCSARVSVGQYLKDWHPDEDYRAGYSANRSLGGGVILDLIHEIDLLYAWFGRPTDVKAIAGKQSTLEIETEDVAEIICRFENGVIGSVHVDYVQRVPSRQGRIVGDRGTIVYDLLANECRLLSADAPPAIQTFPDFVRNDMYVDEVRHFLAAAAGGPAATPSLRDGTAVLDAALRARRDAGLDAGVTAARG